MSSLKFSIVCPVFNGEKYLKSCIESVLKQSYKNWELIIVNDGSIDNSQSIIDKFLPNKKIKSLIQKNQGQSKARFNALLASTGDYVIFLDCDDMLKTDALKILSTIIEKNHPEAIVFNFKQVAENKFKLKKIKKIQGFGYLMNGECLEYCFVKNRIGYLWQYCIQLNKLNINLFKTNIKYTEDTMILFEIMKNIKLVVYTEKELYFYRINTDGITNTLTFNLRMQGFNVFNNILKELCFEYGYTFNDFSNFNLEYYSYLPISLLYAVVKLKDWFLYNKIIRTVRKSILFTNFSLKFNYEEKTAQCIKFLLKFRLYHLLYQFVLLRLRKQP